MYRQIQFVLFFCAGATLLSGAENGIKDFTPDAGSPTAMRRCGAELEKVKTGGGYTRRYIFDGTEEVAEMETCRNGKLVISHRTYRPTPGSVGFLNEESARVVFEGCVNQAKLITPIPPPEVKEPEPPAPLPPLVLRAPPSDLTVWTPTTPAIARYVCPHCAAIVSDYLLGELSVKSKPVKVRAIIQDGTVVNGIWKFNGIVVGHGVEFLLDPPELFKATHGKAGKYFLQFIGNDAKGDIIICGLEGTPIQLEKHGRNWVLVILNHIPCVHAVIHPKKWKGWDGVEKGVCLAAAGGAVWLSVEGGAAAAVKTGVVVTHL